jgi:hypothetical protein
MQRISKKSLQLKTETLRSLRPLDAAALAQAAGGSGNTCAGGGSVVTIVRVSAATCYTCWDTH